MFFIEMSKSENHNNDMSVYMSVCVPPKFILEFDFTELYTEFLPNELIDIISFEKPPEPFHLILYICLSLLFHLSLNLNFFLLSLFPSHFHSSSYIPLFVFLFFFSFSPSPFLPYFFLCFSFLYIPTPFYSLFNILLLSLSPPNLLFLFYISVPPLFISLFFLCFFPFFLLFPLFPTLFIPFSLFFIFSFFLFIFFLPLFNYSSTSSPLI